MSAALAALGAGFLFGIGLWLSGMANPAKVLGFLDVAGAWDPTLLLVMAGAVAVTLAFFPQALKRSRPLFAGAFSVPARKEIDGRLLGGSAIFGLGWGIGGYCPGPALTALSNLSLEVAVFVAAMVAGGLLHRLVPEAPPASRARELAPD